MYKREPLSRPLHSHPRLQSCLIAPQLFDRLVRLLKHVVFRSGQAGSGPGERLGALAGMLADHAGAPSVRDQFPAVRFDQLAERELFAYRLVVSARFVAVRLDEACARAQPAQIDGPQPRALAPLHVGPGEGAHERDLHRMIVLRPHGGVGGQSLERAIGVHHRPVIEKDVHDRAEPSLVLAVPAQGHVSGRDAEAEDVEHVLDLGSVRGRHGPGHQSPASPICVGIEGHDLVPHAHLADRTMRAVRHQDRGRGKEAFVRSKIMYG